MKFGFMYVTDKGWKPTGYLRWKYVYSTLSLDVYNVYGLLYNTVSICHIHIEVNRTGELEIIWKEAVMA